MKDINSSSCAMYRAKSRSVVMHESAEKMAPWSEGFDGCVRWLCFLLHPPCVVMEVTEWYAMGML